MTVRQLLRSGIAWCRATLRYDLQDEVAQHSIVVLSGHSIRLALGLVSSALLARGLGPAGLSVFSVVGAGMMIGVTVADLGLSNSAIRYIAGDLTAAPERARRTAGTYARFKVVGGLLAIGIVVALATPLARILNLPERSGPTLVWIAGLGLFATALSGIVATILQTLRRFRVLVLTQTLNIGLTVLLMAGLFIIGRLTVVPALLVGVITTIAASVLGWFLVPTDWRRAIVADGGLRGLEGRRLLSFSRWLWISAILSILSAQLDLLLLNRWMAPQIVGLYALALNLSLKANIVNQTLHTVLLPIVSALSGTAAHMSYIRRSLTRSLILSGLVLLALPFARPFIIAVYGTEYESSVNVFYFLMSVILLDLFTMPVLLLAFPMNMPRLIATSDGMRVVTLLAAGALAIPVWGMYGAVLAKLAAKIAGALVLGLAIAFRLGTGSATTDAISPDPHTAPARPPPDAT